MSEDLSKFAEFGKLGMPRAGVDLWQNTPGYGFVGPKLDFLSDEQNARMERIRVARMLWKGQHRRAFLWEGRTQFDFTPMRIGTGVIQPYVTFNVLKLISTTLTDLLLGAEPLLKVEGDVQQAALDDLAERSDLHRVYYDAAREASWAAESMVEISRWAEEIYISNVEPDELYPIGPRNPDGQYSMYRRFAIDYTREATPRPLLLETTYGPGTIDRKCFFLDGTRKTSDAGLSLWPTKQADGKDLPESEATGIDVPTIVWMANELDGGQPTSDYDGLIELQDELNHKQTQIARVIAKHSDPKIAIPDAMADPEGNIRGNADVFFVRSKEEIPTYITWNAELANAMADRDFTLNAICIAAELSQGLLGLEKGGAPDSARKLRLQATKSLARKDRKASFVRPFIRTSIDTATALQNRSRFKAIAMNGVALELRDGLPVDDLDEANTLSTLKAAGLISLERAVEKQLPDPAAAEKEIALIKADRAEMTPSILLQPPGEGGGEPGEVPPAARQPAEEVAA
jgi:hypothetical protein